MKNEQLYKLFLENPVVCTDTRNATMGSVFFALKGDTFDGNDYALKALETCAFAVVDRAELASEARCFFVDNVLEALQNLARYHRRKLNTTILSITGTNGKTTTKELVAAILKKKYSVVATEGNLNNHIGVPLTLLRLTPEDHFGIIEMGASGPQEIARLCEIAMPNFGLITNVGKAHLEGFGSFDGVKKAKAEMYDYLYEHDGVAFVNADNENLEDMRPPRKSIMYGKSKFTHCQGEILGSEPFLKMRWVSTENMLFDEEVAWDDPDYLINSQLVGNYNFENILAAVCIGNYFGVPAQKIKQAVEEYKPVNNRSQLVKTEKNTLFLDMYNANPTSMEAAIFNFKLLDVPGKFAILGDMLELGKSSQHEHKAILDLLETSGFEKLILVGENFKNVANSQNHLAFVHVDELVGWILSNPVQNKNILVKGSRGVHLEKIIGLL